MGWKSWLFIAIVLVLAGVWLWRKLFGGKGKNLPFIGLAPLTGGWKAMKDYVGGLGGYLLDDDDDEGLPPVAVAKKPRVLDVLQIQPKDQQVAVTIPRSWDFRDISGSHKRERIVRRVLETLFNREFPSVRPKWLRNPQSNRPLEIDCYNEELGLAVEHHGEQHYVDSTSFHKTRQDFLKQVYRDRVKKKIILDRGLNFLAVPYSIRQDQIPQYIITHLQELGYF